ncbi:hypothetical protein E2C01_057178 [Portunus trituberculatus]|uniref:Uncharacterized protein n=1 Tax=Portunus trituberculatus TaxID=210409 RepID=A0A5B7H0D2_PORTR|nr:hypothetical protein [Portunus trituberculatus]
MSFISKKESNEAIQVETRVLPPAFPPPAVSLPPHAAYLIKCCKLDTFQDSGPVFSSLRCAAITSDSVPGAWRSGKYVTWGSIPCPEGATNFGWELV